MAPKKFTYSRKSSHAARAAHARGAREFKTYDTSAIRPKKSRAPFIIAGIVALVIIAIVVVAVLFGCSESENPNLLAEGEEVTLEIEADSSLSSIAEQLYNAGVINSQKKFISAANSQDAASSLQAGTYTFTGGSSYDEVVDVLVSGAITALTIPEGVTLETIATLVEEAYGGEITAEDFLAEANNASAYESEFSFVSGAYDDSLEGFLFPKTYKILTGASASTVIKQMLSQYAEEVETLDYSYAEEQGYSHYEVLILASIIEKEATDDTRSKVSAVFWNRLTTQGAPCYGYLGSDATTAYEVGSDLDSYDWTTESPYNTRVTKGLCPTPICSPSLDSLEAACNPEDNFDDYYFFSFWENDDGEVEYYFDKTYEDHQATVEEHS